LTSLYIVGTAKEKRDHTWSALLAAYEEGYDRVVKLLLDQGNPFKGMESETLTDRLWKFAHMEPGNDKVE
jgi:phage tail tape-measure protein